MKKRRGIRAFILGLLAGALASALAPPKPKQPVADGPTPPADPETPNTPLA